MKRSSKWWKQLQDPLSIKLPARAHVPLVRCRVQLLGRAAPADIADGLHAIQKPLHELFECYSPVESILTAYTSGLVVRTPADVDVGVEELWFPIQDLMECGAMRPIGGHPPTAFAPISTLEAQATKGPAIFAFCFKRRDIPVSDCWAVQCQSDDAAMALLSACMMAHKNPAGWGSAVDRPPSTIPTKNASRAPRSEEWDGAVAKDAALWSNKFQRDYYEKPPLQGFYYTPSPGLIQHYALGEMMQYFVEEEMPENGESLMPDAEDSQQPIQPEEVSYLRQPGNRNHRPSRFPEDAYYPSSMNGRPARGAPVVYPNQTDMYGQPIGSMGSFVPESLIFPDDKYTSSSDSDAHHGKKHDKHKKKKKSKKSRHGKDQK